MLGIQNARYTNELKLKCAANPMLNVLGEKPKVPLVLECVMNKI